MIVYPDTSLLFSWYVPDLNTGAADVLIGTRPRLLVTEFHRAEMANALFQWVFRGKLTEAEASKVHLQFQEDQQREVFLSRAVPEEIYLRSTRLAEQHVAVLGTRTLDTMHVAAALELNAVEFWSFDQRQLRLAHAVGLRTNRLA